jgi:hypothetical protein
MSVVSSPRATAEEVVAAPEQKRPHARSWIGWSSVSFAVLQSVRTAFRAMAGLRLVVGVGSLALSAEATQLMNRMHADWLRVPMMSLALVGAPFNMAALLRIWRLRRHPASQWRMAPLPARKLRMERWQMALSIATLVLPILEETFHLHLTHHL